MNEQLYTHPEGEVFASMQGNPGLFGLYHTVKLRSRSLVMWRGLSWHESGRDGLWPL